MTDQTSSTKKGSTYKAVFVFTGLFIGLSISLLSFVDISSNLILGVVFGILTGYTIFMMTLDNLNEYRKASIKVIKEAFLINLFFGILIGSFIWMIMKFILSASSDASRVFLPTFFVSTFGTIALVWYFWGPDTETKQENSPN